MRRARPSPWPATATNTRGCVTGSTTRARQGRPGEAPRRCLALSRAATPPPARPEEEQNPRGWTQGFCRCPRGDLNPHALIRALAPQASASAYSATRTSAQESSSKTHPVSVHRGRGTRMPRWTPCPIRLSAVPTTPPPRSSDSAATSSASTPPMRATARGRGSARPPSTSPRCSTRSGIESERRARPTPGRHQRARPVGRRRQPRRPPLLVHGHLDVVPADADDWQVHPFSGEIQRRLRLGPRRGRHEGLRRDDARPWCAPAPGPAGARPRPIVLCFTADEEAGGHQGRRAPRRAAHRELLEDCTEAVGEVGGFSATVRGRRIYLVEAAEKGMAWMRLTARGTAGHGSMRNPDNAVTTLAAAVARIGAHQWPVRLTPDDGGAARRRRRPGRHRGDPGERRGAGRGVRRRRPDARRGHPQHRQPDHARAPATRSTSCRPPRPRRTLDGRFLPGYEDEFFATLRRAASARTSTSTASASSPPWRRRTTARLVDAMDALAARRGPRRAGGAVPHERRHRRQALRRKLGIRCFGFAPLRLPADLDFTALFHGVDERVPGRRAGVRRPGLRPVPRHWPDADPG